MALTRKEIDARYRKSLKGKATLKRQDLSEAGKLRRIALREKHKESWAQKHSDYYHKYGGKIRYYERHLIKTYGINLQQKEELLLAQDCKCAICQDRLELYTSDHNLMSCVDHDHKTGKIRGLLCNPCNKALGNLKDSIDRAQKLILYLGKNE